MSMCIRLKSKNIFFSLLFRQRKCVTRKETVNEYFSHNVLGLRLQNSLKFVNNNKHMYRYVIQDIKFKFSDIIFCANTKFVSCPRSSFVSMRKKILRKRYILRNYNALLNVYFTIFNAKQSVLISCNKGMNAD